MREVKKKSVAPIYGFAAVWLIYCLFFPLYRLWHFIIAICCSVAAHFVLSLIFPGKTIYIEEPKAPVSTGNPEIDALVAEGERASAEMRRLQKSIKDKSIISKIDVIVDISEKIFKDVVHDSADYRQVKRFADYYLPTTIKLLNAYDRMGSLEYEGENITGTMGRIETILDKTIEAYKKQLDALFADQALDIETDITVLENMLRREGFADSDFKTGGAFAKDKEQNERK